MRIAFAICYLFLFANLSFAQLDPFAVVGAGKSIFGSIKDKKKSKNIQSSLSEVDINGNKVSILRVPEDKIVSNGKAFILKVQNLLDGYQQKYKQGEHIEVPYSDNNLYDIKALDPDWPTSYYEAELREYRQYGIKLAEKQRRYKDSLETASRINKQRQEDSLRIARKKLEDSLDYVERTKDFHFINKEFVLLKEKPSDKSKTVGKIYLGSYVKVLGFSESTGYLKVSLQDVEGFVKQTEVAGSLDALAASEGDLKIFKSRQYYKYEPNYDYEVSSQPQQSQSLYTQSSGVSSGKSSSKSSGKARYSSARTYYRGPRGGCYYLSSSGGKVYVDRSYCN